MNTGKLERMCLHTKRFFDIGLTIPALVVLLPAMGVIALLVRIRLGSPVLFKQQRLGLMGRPFVLYKFRTMADIRNEQGNILPDERRLTPFGRFLRETSLDELPELFNVLLGHMSVVGPRPLPLLYQDRFSVTQWRRHEVKPGITGLVQVSGRNALDWERKFELDVWYVDHWSLWLDCQILCRTLLHLVQREGISHSGYATMPEFLGRSVTIPDPADRSCSFHVKDG